MTKTRLLGAAAIAAAIIATPAMAQKKMKEPGAYKQDQTQVRTQTTRKRDRDAGPVGAAAGVAAGAVATAGTIATAPFRGFDNSYAYSGDRRMAARRGKASCGYQVGGTYLGPDGQWYPC
jgi:hypothetical protein